jgi:hypothetical protein
VRLVSRAGEQVEVKQFRVDFKGPEGALYTGLDSGCNC